MSKPHQVIILAGGKGTRLMEKTTEMPKPLLQVGDKSLLEWIIQGYSNQGYHEFLIPVGYLKQEVFSYFGQRASRILHEQKIDHKLSMLSLTMGKETLTIVDTGEETQTAGRILRLQPHISGSFLLTYGDGLSNVNLHQLLETHDRLGATVTLTAIHPMPRFGALEVDEQGFIRNFNEKGDYLQGWINGGFMVCEPELFDEIDDDEDNLESDILPKMTFEHKVGAHKFEGFWQCVDVERDLKYLNDLDKEGARHWTKLSG